ncbi:MAG: Cna B-type domain-containing protein, partial [Clostridiales bacterium]|nr:Cna B-type domain-containing protein [Clostridiales bacterium]
IKVNDNNISDVSAFKSISSLAGILHLENNLIYDISSLPDLYAGEGYLEANIRGQGPIFWDLRALPLDAGAVYTFPNPVKGKDSVDLGYTFSEEWVSYNYEDNTIAIDLSKITDQGAVPGNYSFVQRWEAEDGGLPTRRMGESNPLHEHVYDKNFGGKIVYSFDILEDPVEISVEKIWEKGDPANRPAVELILYRHTQSNPTKEKVITVPLDGSESPTPWAKNFPHDFEKKDLVTGEEYVYTLEEVKIPDYDTNITGNDGPINGKFAFTVTNVYTPLMRSVEGYKQWLDEFEENAQRPDIFLYLERAPEGSETFTKVPNSEQKVVTPTGETRVDVVWQNMRAEDETGAPYQYRVREEPIKDEHGGSPFLNSYEALYEDIHGEELGVINTRKEITLRVEKIWKGVEESEQVPVTINIMRYNIDEMDPDTQWLYPLPTAKGTLMDQVTLDGSAPNYWTSGMFYYPEADSLTGMPYFYFPKEETISGFVSTPGYGQPSDASLTLTVTNTPARSVEGYKKWVDEHEPEGERPTITLFLERAPEDSTWFDKVPNSEKEVVTPKGATKVDVVWENMPIADHRGVAYQYRVGEEMGCDSPVMRSYDVRYEGEQGVELGVVNTRKRIPVTVGKEWDGVEESKQVPVTIHIMRYDPSEIDPYTGLPKPDATGKMVDTFIVDASTQWQAEGYYPQANALGNEPYYYYPKEEPLPGFSDPPQIWEVGIEIGKLFIITNTPKTTMDIVIDKKWSHANMENLPPPDYDLMKVMIGLYANDVFQGEYRLTNGGPLVIKNMPLLNETGNKINYTVKELTINDESPDDMEYSTSIEDGIFNETTNTLTFTIHNHREDGPGNKVIVEVYKEDQYGHHIQGAVFELYPNGSSEPMTHEGESRFIITEEWTPFFLHDIVPAGNHILKEVSVPDGYEIIEEFTHFSVPAPILGEEQTVQVRVKNHKTNKELTIIKEWKNDDASTRVPVTLKLYRQIENGPKTFVQDIVLDGDKNNALWSTK